MVEHTLCTYILTAVVAVLLYRWRFTNLHNIPTIGPSAPILSYIGALRFRYYTRAMLQEGYDKYKGGLFKVAKLDRWLVFVTGSKLIDEIRRIPEEQISFLDAVEDFVQMRYSFGHEVISDPIHIDIVRTQLTRHIASDFQDMRDEIVASFNDLIPTTPSEWVSVTAIPVVQQIIARVSNRVFVGLPMCRHEDYIRLTIDHTMAVAKNMEVMTWTPEPLRPIVGYFVNESMRGIKAGRDYLEPMIQDRLQKMREFGEEWSDKPDDLLQWVMEVALSRGKDIDSIVGYILMVNFGAIHTSSSSFAHALYHLAANPEYADILREEADAVVKAEGWSKSAMQQLSKFDSFLRESSRLNGLNDISLMRKTVQDVTLSNGTFIPAGNMVVVPVAAVHTDSENYSDPEVFSPWRFSDLRSNEGDTTRHQFVSTSVDNIIFGHGKHACPGRFFAANELKAMLAHIVINYDVKFENEGQRPPNVRTGNIISPVSPCPTARVLFRRRQD